MGAFDACDPWGSGNQVGPLEPVPIQGRIRCASHCAPQRGETGCLSVGAVAVLRVSAASPAKKQPVTHQGQTHGHNDGGDLLQSFKHVLYRSDPP